MKRRSMPRPRSPLALGARMAATTLGAGLRRAHEIGCGHRPVGLRWRRQPAAGAVVRAFTRRTTSVTWAPRISLHFKIAVHAERSYRKQCAQRGAPITHRHMHQGWHSIHSTVASPLIARAVHSHRRHLPESGLFGGRVLSVDGRGRPLASPRTRLAGALVLDRARPALVARDSVRLTDRFIDRVLTSISRSTVRRVAIERRWEPSDPRPTRGTLRPHHAGAARHVTHRPVELAWRQSHAEPAGTAKRVPTEVPISAAPSARPSSTSPPTSAGVTTAAPGASTPRAVSLDSSQLDRLAEDVIRRVERRVRIARERRGL